MAHSDFDCPACGQQMKIVEGGYERTWTITEITEGTTATEGDLVTVYEDSGFDESGAGDDHLRCPTDLTEKPLPAGVEVDYR